MGIGRISRIGRVGRVGGVAAFTPASLSGLVLWGEPGTNGSKLFQERTGASATTPAVAASDPVGTWKFQTGQYWTAPTDDTTRPLVLIDGTKPLVDFDGTNDELIAGDLSALVPSAGTVVARFKITNAAAAAVGVFQSGNVDAYDRFNDQNSYPSILRSARVETQPIIPRAAFVTVAYRSSASAWSRRRDGAEDSTAAAAYSAGTNWKMGRVFTGGTEKWFSGPFACLIAYSRVLSDSECALVEAYAATLTP